MGLDDILFGAAPAHKQAPGAAEFVEGVITKVEDAGVSYIIPSWDNGAFTFGPSPYSGGSGVRVGVLTLIDQGPVDGREILIGGPDGADLFELSEDGLSVTTKVGGNYTTSIYVSQTPIGLPFNKPYYFNFSPGGGLFNAFIRAVSVNIDGGGGSDSGGFTGGSGDQGPYTAIAGADSGPLLPFAFTATDLATGAPIDTTDWTGVVSVTFYFVGAGAGIDVGFRCLVLIPSSENESVAEPWIIGAWPNG